jgi:D-alanine transfer protein
MKHPKFGPFLLALALFGILLFMPVQYLFPLISDDKVEQAATSLDTDMFQGTAIQKKMLQDHKYLPLYGSSELSRLDIYHPSNYFKINPEGFTPYLIGRGGTQSLVHFLSLAATSNEIKNQRIVFILSPQWFIKEGLDDAHFSPNFSTLQAYDFVFNSNLTPKMKKKAAKRLLKFEVVRQDKLLTTMLEGLVHDDFVRTCKAGVMKPFAYTYKNVLERKDIVTTLTNGKKRKPNTDASLKGLSLEQLSAHAEQTGARESRSNTFGIVDKYYHHKVAPKLSELKGYKARESYDKSPEYEDLQMILDLLKQNNTKALFVSIPVNGPWYDYAEFPKERRYVYYQKIRHFIEKDGFPVADFSAHEYDTYFMKDTIHIGWKGWVYMNESLKQFHHITN